MKDQRRAMKAQHTTRTTRWAGQSAAAAEEGLRRAQEAFATSPLEAWNLLEEAEQLADEACDLALESGTPTARRHRDRAETVRMQVRSLRRKIPDGAKGLLEFEILDELAAARFGDAYTDLERTDPRRETMRDEIRWALPAVKSWAAGAFRQAAHAVWGWTGCSADIDDLPNPYVS